MTLQVVSLSLESKEKEVEEERGGGREEDEGGMIPAEGPMEETSDLTVLEQTSSTTLATDLPRLHIR